MWIQTQLRTDVAVNTDVDVGTDTVRTSDADIE